MAAEEAAAATEETTAAKPEKEEMTEDILEDETFDFQNLIGQERAKAEKEELKEYAISCGYRPRALLFGGIDDEKLGCIRDQTGAKVIGTLSKSIGFLKLKADISCYRRQHIVGSLFYSNFTPRLDVSIQTQNSELELANQNSSVWLVIELRN
jgi:hypothetical protein